MEQGARFQCFIDEDNQVIVIRAIGDIPPATFVDLVFEKLSAIPEPWTFGRLFDVRRWEHRLGAETVRALAERWVELTEGKIYHARIAVVTHDHGTQFRTAVASEHFPDETVCYFDDYHEASGWLRSTDPAGFLKSLAGKPPNQQSYGGIVIE